MFKIQVKMKKLVFAALLVASISSKAQQIQFYGLEKAKVVFASQKNTGEETEIKATMDVNDFEALPYGNVTVTVTSDIPLSLRIVEESYTGRKTVTVFKASKSHEIQVLVTDGYVLTIIPFTDNSQTAKK